MFRTRHLPKDSEHDALYVGLVAVKRFPTGHLGQWMAPFRRVVPKCADDPAYRAQRAARSEEEHRA